MTRSNDLSLTLRWHRSLRALGGLAILLCAAGAANAAVCRVSPAGTGDGSSWLAAAPLQAALADGNCGEIWVKQGTYTPTATNDRAISFAINRPLKLYGGFAGVETVLAQRSTDNGRTVLSGDIGTPGDHSDNSYHVVVIGGISGNGNGNYSNSDTVVDGLSIVNGYANGTGLENASGGGLVCNGVGSAQSCSPQISNVTFRGNRALNDGGAALFLNNTGPLILQSTFTSNEAGTSGVGGEGGAIYVYSQGFADSSILQSTFDRNSAYGGGSISFSGAIAVVPTRLEISQSTFTGSSAASRGDIILSRSGNGMGAANITINQSTFNGNPAASNDFLFFSVGATYSVTIENSILIGNSAGFQVIGSGSASINTSIMSGSCPGNVTCSVDGLYSVDALLTPLADNGGPTQTMLPGIGSPALGVANACTSSSVDQRGAPRPTSGSCDLGAVQRQAVAPGAPTGFSATAGNAFLNLSWAAGGGGWPHYVVKNTTGGGSDVVCATTATACTVAGLVNGTPYTFTVTASNEAGSGTAPVASGTPLSPPVAPTAVTGTAGNGWVDVVWTAPTGAAGASPVTGYRVTAVEDGTKGCTSTAGSPVTPACRVIGLTNGTPYTFVVLATSHLGDSLLSIASAPVTPAAPVVAPPPVEDTGPTSTVINTPGSTTTITNPSLPVVVGPGAGGSTIVLPGTGTTPVGIQVIVNGQPLLVQALPGTQLRITEVHGQSVLVLVVLEGWASMTSSAVGQPMVLAGAVLLSSGSANTIVQAQPLLVAVQVGSLTAPAGSLPAVGRMGLQAGERLQVNGQGAVVSITLGSLKGDTQQPGDAMAFANLPDSITVDKAFARLAGALARLSGGNLAQGLEVAPSGVVLVRDGGLVFQLLPMQPITIDATQPDGLAFTPLGLLRWVRGGVVVQFAPAVADLAGLANAATAVLPDAQIRLGAEGVLQLRTGGQTYVLKPDWTGAGTAVGTPHIVVDSQGRIRLHIGQGAGQLLLPSLLNTTQASAIFQAAIPGSALAVQPASNEGAFTITLAGQQWRLVPQGVLPQGNAANVPPQAGPWWMGADGLLYLKLGTQVQGVRITD